MYTRLLDPPSAAFFLFGPRATGKSTWIKARFPNAHIIDLLPPNESLRYQKDPSMFRAEVLALPKKQWVVVDEVQRAPPLLDEVHFLMENHGFKKFVLTGSSARKVRRGAANLLAGRALLRKMYPLNAKETNYTIPIKQVMTYGMLPLSVTAPGNGLREGYLRSYVQTYLNEEIKFEGLVRQIGSFARFLEIASLTAGHSINISGLARESGVGRDTIRGYFGIFEDTLLGSWLPAYRPRARIKEVFRPKFYWFDCGVLNAAAGGLDQPMPKDWDGVLLEHWIYHEIISYLDYSGSKGTLGYWATPSESEIDFLWWYGKEMTAVEVKSSTRLRPEYLKGIQSFGQSTPLRSSWLVYQGDKELKVGKTWVLPVMTFLKKLHKGEILGT